MDYQISPVTVNIIKLTSTAKMPVYHHDGDSGCDVFSDQEDTRMLPGEISLISTGLCFDIPTGFEIQVRSKSGLTLQGLVVPNSPGNPMQAHSACNSA